MAWHGYGGNVAMQTTIHDEFPSLSAYDTEHSGGTWIPNQQQEDMRNIVDYTRNWGRTVTKWSLAVDQNMGPHNGGCGTCTGLITVHNGYSRSGQVDFTVEYYDMGTSPSSSGRGRSGSRRRPRPSYPTSPGATRTVPRP